MYFDELATGILIFRTRQLFKHTQLPVAPPSQHHELIFAFNITYPACFAEQMSFFNIATDDGSKPFTQDKQFKSNKK